MLLPRWFAAASQALLIAGLVLLCRGGVAPAQATAGACADAADFAMLASPIAPWKGAPLRVLLTSERPVDGELSLIGPDGRVAATSRERHGGPPYFWIAEVETPAPGAWQARLSRRAAPSGCGAIVHAITVRGDR